MGLGRDVGRVGRVSVAEPREDTRLDPECEGARGARRVRRVAVVCVHTSPLDQPGVGDSGGMNVYVRSLADELARRGIESDIFTRASDPKADRVVDLSETARVINVPAGPAGPVDKHELPRYLSEFLCALLRFGSAAGRPYDVIHSHYWLSGWVGRLLRERWHVPMAASFHTLGKVKNLMRGREDSAEPAARIAGEARVVASADAVFASTPAEASELIGLYGAPAERVKVVSPGVRRELFHPGDRAAAKAALGVSDKLVVGFVGRLQPLKGASIALAALADLRRRRPDLHDRLLMILVGGASGNGKREPERLRALAADLRLDGAARFLEPIPHDAMPSFYRACDVLIVPSYSESFGLVALEAQACGVPVIASAVGGLNYIVDDQATGRLVKGHEPADFSRALEDLLDDPHQRDVLGASGARLAARYCWEDTASRVLEAYEDLVGRSAEGEWMGRA
ncbi:MAG: D-inositol-3-phosphate glycosyltransferase [Actinomycetota bacterium]